MNIEAQAQQEILGVMRGFASPRPDAIAEALTLAVRYGGIDGDHHRTWVIDQMVRALAGDNYAALVADAKAGEDGPETYSWDEGIAP